MKKILVLIFLLSSCWLYGSIQEENESRGVANTYKMIGAPFYDVYTTTGDIIPGKEKRLVKFKQKYSDVSMESLEDTVIAMVQRYMPYTDFVHHKSSIIDSLQMRDFTQLDIYFMTETYYTDNSDSKK